MFNFTPQAVEKMMAIIGEGEFSENEFRRLEGMGLMYISDCKYSEPRRVNDLTMRYLLRLNIEGTPYYIYRGFRDE